MTKQDKYLLKYSYTDYPTYVLYDGFQHKISFEVDAYNDRVFVGDTLSHRKEEYRIDGARTYWSALIKDGYQYINKVNKLK